VKTLVFERNPARFASARLASHLGAGRGAAFGPLRLVDAPAPDLPGPGWHRVTPRLAGICGSDLATVDGRSSRYFADLVSFPFVPGHEVVGTAVNGAVDADGAPVAPGSRVVIEPVLGCRARGIEPPCAACATGPSGGCTNVAFGHLAPGLQTGFCTDTGGGWSAAGLVAHDSQIHVVPETLADADAVTIEPVACAVHAVLRAGLNADDVVAVLGAGTLGLAVTAALTHLGATGRLATPRTVLVGARYAHQRALAANFGPVEAVPDDQLGRAVRGASRSLALGAPRRGGQRLTGGADVVIDCVGSAASIAQSLQMVAPRGRVVLVGMPARVHVDLASLWHREVALVGAYAYGTEALGTGSADVRTFALATEVVSATGFGKVVSATYPLERFEEAIAHAGAAGRRGAVKIAFDLSATAPRPAPTPVKGRRP
jgi:threonine dehydrogenase-like Zn-dependent dehydrogenase